MDTNSLFDDEFAHPEGGTCWLLSDTERSSIAGLLDVEGSAIYGDVIMIQPRKTCPGCSKRSGLDDMVHNAMALGIHSKAFLVNILLDKESNQDVPPRRVNCSRCNEFIGVFQWTAAVDKHPPLHLHSSPPHPSIDTTPTASLKCYHPALIMADSLRAHQLAEVSEFSRAGASRQQRPIHRFVAPSDPLAGQDRSTPAVPAAVVTQDQQPIEVQYAQTQMLLEAHYQAVEELQLEKLAIEEEAVQRPDNPLGLRLRQYQYGLQAALEDPSVLSPAEYYQLTGLTAPLVVKAHTPLHMRQQQNRPTSPTIPMEETPFNPSAKVWPSEAITTPKDQRTQQINALDSINKRIDAELDRSPALEPVTKDAQISWEQMEHRMRSAYVHALDKGVMDCLIRQQPETFLFFDIKYTHVGDYLEIGFPRAPAQICLMNITGDIIYQANMAMFDPRDGKEILCMVDWLQLVNEYLITGAMSRRWFDLDRVKAAIQVMRGYFSSTEIKRLSIQNIRADLDKLDYRGRILFTHDRSLRTYDLLRKMLLTNTLPPRLLTMSSAKMLKMLLPDMSNNLYKFYMQLVDHQSFGAHGKEVYKNMATGDADYVRQIFRFLISCWDTFQKSRVGRPRAEAADRLVDIWDAIPPDTPVFDPASDSDNDDDQGITLAEVEAFDREGMAALEELRDGHRPPRAVSGRGGVRGGAAAGPAREPWMRPIMTENPARGVAKYRGERVENRRPVTPAHVRIEKGDFSFRT
ncbi:hypothetical protein Dda_8366 [Drechslerella dactyloides]|uniref:Uncharacterized protein n=1 Tax=Drechslerella dactyloides TaxID=74499 RepID=A0AAD6IRF4_DREDA|nr:hypothetical protein Dda_8366 [Drechslerella dactyloides]